MPTGLQSHRLSAIVLVLTGLVATPAFAQYQTRPPAPPKASFSDEVTVTATGVETEVDEAPTAVTVVTRDEMDDAQADRVVESVAELTAEYVAQILRAC